MTKVSRSIGILILIVAGFIGIAFLAYSWHLTDIQETTLSCQQMQLESPVKAHR